MGKDKNTPKPIWKEGEMKKWAWTPIPPNQARPWVYLECSGGGYGGKVGTPKLDHLMGPWKKFGFWALRVWRSSTLIHTARLLGERGRKDLEEEVFSVGTRIGMVFFCRCRLRFFFWMKHWEAGGVGCNGGRVEGGRGDEKFGLKSR